MTATAELELTLALRGASVHQLLLELASRAHCEHDALYLMDGAENAGLVWECRTCTIHVWGEPVCPTCRRAPRVEYPCPNCP